MSFKSFYSKYKNFSQKKLNIAFNEACVNGNLDEVRYLLTSTELKEHADIHFNNDNGLSDACWEGHLEIVKYLLTSPELTEHAFINDHQEKDSNGLLNACGAGHLEIVKYLLTSPELKEHSIINWQFMPPIGVACEEGHLKVVKYLLTSPELKEHSVLDIYTLVSAIPKDQIHILKYLTSSEFSNYYNIHDDNDFLFKRALYHESKECIQYLIFDLNITSTDNIKQSLEIKDDNRSNENFIHMVEKMFNARQLNSELVDEIPYSSESHKRVKL
jgi:ankyrin repeat protein